MTDSKMFSDDEKALALPSHEDIGRVAYCVGVYLSAFSKEPFDEKWSVDGQKVSGFLLNPRTTAHFVKELFSQEGLAISATTDGGEQAVVSKGLLLKHLEETLSDPMTGFLCDTEWFSETDKKGLRELREVLINSKKKNIDIYIPYPLTGILKSHVDAMSATYAVITLGYHDDWEYKHVKGQSINENNLPLINSEFKLIRITPKSNIPDNIYPRFFSRSLNINHPGASEKENAAELAIKETSYYLGPKEQNHLAKKIDPGLYTCFWGEVAKIPDKDNSLQGVHLSAFKYMEAITERNSKTTNYDIKDMLPKQILFMSLPGTAVERISKQVNGKESGLLKTIRSFCEPYGLKYKEEILVFPKSGNRSVLFGVIKQV